MGKSRAYVQTETGPYFATFCTISLAKAGVNSFFAAGIKYLYCAIYGIHSGPVTAIQGAVLDGFSKVLDGDVRGAFQVGNSAGDFQDAVMSAGGEPLLLHGALQQALGVGGKLAESANLLGGHLRIREDLGLARGFDGGMSKPFVLPLAGSENAGANLGGAFSGSRPAQLFVLHGGDLNVDVDAIQQWAGDLGDVALNLRWCAHTAARGVIEVTAGASLRCLSVMPSFGLLNPNRQPTQRKSIP
jgi:hypothetical protein